MKVNGGFVAGMFMLMNAVRAAVQMVVDVDGAGVGMFVAVFMNMFVDVGMGMLVGMRHLPV